MNTEQLEFRATDAGRSQNARLRDYLTLNPRQWIPMPELARIIGAYAVHSRIADLRTKFGMTIESKATVDTTTGQRHSFYRYLPADEASAV